jgi:exopolysaccharide biosynthesis polyprenyl glycosylphosphotransferase
MADAQRGWSSLRQGFHVGRTAPPMLKKDATALDLRFVEELSVDEPAPLRLRVGNPDYPRWQRILKRGVDIGFSLLVMTLGAPVFLFLAAAVKLSSPGPVFFRQTRLGLNEVPFTFYKFRSMQHENDDASHRDFCREFISGEFEDDDDRTVFKMVGDPRITWIGRFLRRTSLDELPQFYNVLRGEMSLVGPRPPISYEIEHYQDWHKDRLKVKPGLTGLWQVSGRSTVGFDEMVLLDFYYINHWNLKLDLKIVAATVPVMVKGEGAY